MSRCYACCQENCAHGPCSCDCHKQDKTDKVSTPPHPRERLETRVTNRRVTSPENHAMVRALRAENESLKKRLAEWESSFKPGDEQLLRRLADDYIVGLVPTDKADAFRRALAAAKRCDRRKKARKK